MIVELRYYQTSAGEQPFVEWMQGLRDRHARTRIEARLARVAVDNLGDIEPVGEGVMEMRGGGSPPLWRGQKDAAKGHQTCEELS